MKIVCAWCGKDMGEKEPLEDKSITHGMCKECYKKQTGEEYMEDLMDKAKSKMPEAIAAAERAVTAASKCDPNNMFYNMMAFYLGVNRETYRGRVSMVQTGPQTLEPKFSDRLDSNDIKEVIARVEHDVVSALGKNCGCKLGGQPQKKESAIQTITGAIKQVSGIQGQALKFAVDHPELVLAVASKL